MYVRACEVVQSLEALCRDADDVADDTHEGDASDGNMAQEELRRHPQDVVVSSDDATMTQSRVIH